MRFYPRHIFCSCGLFVFGLLQTLSVQAQVLMDNTCNLMEDMYVITIDNEDQIANEAMAMETLRKIYKERGRRPSYLGMDSWGQIEAYQKFNDNAYQLTRIAVLVDTLHQNISLMVHSDHQKQDLKWETDNIAFIDGKTNSYADFRCSGDWIQLKWNGRDLSSGNELFDSAEGMLSARIEGFFNEASQPDTRLKIARLSLSYPRTGLSGAISSLYQSSIKGRTPHPHTYNYEYSLENPVTLVMNGKNRPGYQPLDQQRVNFDVETLAMAQDESSSQNTLSPHMPVSLSTVRTHLQYVKTMLTNEAALYTRSVYSVSSLHTLIDHADNYIQRGLAASGMEQDLQFDSALKQFAELASRLHQNREISASASAGQSNLVARQHRVAQVTKQVDKILAKLSEELQSDGMRRSLLKDYQQQQAKINFNLIDDSELLSSEPDLFAKDAFPQLEKDIPHPRNLAYQSKQVGSATKPVDTSSIKNKEEFLETCLMTKNREGVFGSAVNARHYGFDVGLEIRLLYNNSWLMELESTRTPWTLPIINAYGSNYQIPQRDTWCHGPFFGADHARDNIRMTVRGIYDAVNHKMYVAALWGIWDKSRVLAMVQSFASAAVLPGVALLGGFLAPTIGVPLAVAFVAASTTTTLALTPWSPPETRFAHVRMFTRKMAEMGMGDRFYKGAGGMHYYSTFGTMKPKGNID